MINELDLPLVSWWRSVETLEGTYRQCPEMPLIRVEEETSPYGYVVLPILPPELVTALYAREADDGTDAAALPDLLRLAEAARVLWRHRGEPVTCTRPLRGSL